MVVVYSGHKIGYVVSHKNHNTTVHLADHYVQMNTREKLGQCWSLNYGIKGMSAKLTCRKKDTQADWERELVWKEPLVVTFLTTEVVQVSTATN